MSQAVMISCCATEYAVAVLFVVMLSSTTTFSA
jgi:hypothetical protein